MNFVAWDTFFYFSNFDTFCQRLVGDVRRFLVFGVLFNPFFLDAYWCLLPILLLFFIFSLKFGTPFFTFRMFILFSILYRKTSEYKLISNFGRWAVVEGCEGGGLEIGGEIIQIFLFWGDEMRVSILHGSHLCVLVFFLLYYSFIFIYWILEGLEGEIKTIAFYELGCAL